MKLSLVLHDGGKLEFPFSKNSITIGRSPQCDIVVPNEGMSRKHCQIDIKEGEIFITDLASSNGVMIEGQKIQPNVATAYFTYLSLSFGAVSQATLDLEEAPVSKPKVESSLNSSPQARKAPEKKPRMESTGSKKIVPPAAAKNDDKNKMMIKIIGFVVVLALAAYFMTQDKEPAPPTPAEIYN